MRGLILRGVLLLAVVSSRPAYAQDGSLPPADARPKLRDYDVVSVKRNMSSSGAFRMNVGHDRFSAENVTLEQLLTIAYGLKPGLVSGISHALDGARFDVQAKVLGGDTDAPPELSDKELEAMLVPLLQERFGLKVHFETKVQSVFELVTAKAGSKLVAATTDAKNGSYRESWSKESRELTATNILVENLVDYLSSKMQRTVINKTGLEGRYNFELKWSSDDSAESQTEVGPSIYTALEEQLGLKLQTAKAPVRSLVVDYAEVPSVN